MGLFDLIFGKKAPATREPLQPVESPEERRARKLYDFLRGELQYNSGHPYSRLRRLDIGKQLGISGIESLLNLTPEAIKVKYTPDPYKGNVPVEDIVAAIAIDQQSVGKFLKAVKRSQDGALTDSLARPWLNYAVTLAYIDGNRDENFQDYRNADAVARANPEAMKRIFSLAMKHVAMTPFSARLIDTMGYIPSGSQRGAIKEVANDPKFLKDVSNYVLKNLEQGVFFPWVNYVVNLASGLITSFTRYDFKTGIRPYNFSSYGSSLSPAAAEVVKQHIVAFDGIVERKFAEQTTRR